MPAWIPSRLRFGPLEPWQRDQYLVVLTVALAQIGFDLTGPFIPLMVRSLGMTDLAEAALWSGIIVGISPFTGAVMGPIWGTLADRYGRKPMVLRALVMISLMQFVQAAAPTVTWLFWARVVMGFFAGFNPMAMALAVKLSPRERMGQAIGLTQAAQLLPTAIGPTIGGLISDSMGIRANFAMTGVILLIPAALLFFLVQEKTYGGPAERPAPERPGAKPVHGFGSFLSLFGLPGFAVALGILMMARLCDRMQPPMLPLYLIELDTPGPQLATVTGLVVSVGSVAAAVSCLIYGRLTRPEMIRRLLFVSLGGGTLISLLLAMTSSWPQVLLLRLALGLISGGSLSLAYTVGARIAPAERSGLALSVLASCGQLGSAIAPMIAGLVSQASLRVVFAATGGLYLVGASLVFLIPAALTRARRANPSGD